MKKQPKIIPESTHDFFDKITVRFTDNKVNKDGNKKLYLQLYILGKKVMLPVGIFLNPQFWDKTNHRVLPDHPDSSTMNIIIGKAMSTVNNIFIKYYLSEKELTPEKMRTEYINPTLQVDFYGWMEQTIKERKGVITQSSITMHLSVLNKLRGFRKDLCFSDIDKKFITDLEKHFKVKLGNNNNTINKCIKTLKTYIHIAVDRELISKDPFADYKRKPVEVDRVILSEEEIAKLLDIHSKRQGNSAQLRALNYFLFSYYACGVRISDIKRLEWKNIISNTLVFAPVKTSNVSGKIIHIPLSKMANRLARYENKFAISGRIFNCLSDQQTNKVLKEICKVHKIPKNISFHSARHSFATNFLKHNRGDIATLKELLGHSKIEQTMVYVHIDEDDKKNSIKFLDI